MNKLLKNIFIIDGSFMLHRALHLPDVFALTNSKGEHTGGIFQFLRMLNSELRKCGEYFPIVVFDQGLCQRRVDLDPDYKKATERAQQDQMVLTPEEVENDYVTQYRKQRDRLSVILPFFGIPVIKIAGWEGDDLMYILSKISQRSVVLTDDRDMLQLLSETCDVKRPKANEYVTLESFLKTEGYQNTHDFVSCKALLGDSSDNIPGCCVGVGEGNIKGLWLLYKYCKENAIVYPKTEKDLRELCKEIGVNYRKAYLNLDYTRYTINLQLVDLDLVKVNPSILDSIIATVNNSSGTINYFNAIRQLSDLEITDFAIDELMRIVKLKEQYKKVEPYD